MKRLFETIRVENGIARNTEYHLSRIVQSAITLTTVSPSIILHNNLQYSVNVANFDLICSSLIHSFFPDKDIVGSRNNNYRGDIFKDDIIINGVQTENIQKEIIHGSNINNGNIYKLRISYSVDYNIVKIENAELSLYTPRVIERLKVVVADDIDYSLKFEDRGCLNRYKSMYADYDDILFVKNGQITDTSFSNIIFRRDKVWYTPKSVLLGGTCRSRLIDERKVLLLDIYPSDLYNFDSFMLINAMLDLDEDRAVEIGNITFGNSL